MPKNTTAKIGRDVFDHPHPQWLNNYSFFFSFCDCNFLFGRVIYRLERYFQDISNRYITCPQIPIISVAKPQKNYSCLAIADPDGQKNCN